MGHESLLGSKVKKEKKGAGSPVTSGRDELELYLADPEEPHIEVDVLAWPLVAMEPTGPGQTAWGHNGTCGNPINTREPSGDRLMHGNPSKTGEKTGTQGRPRGNPG